MNKAPNKRDMSSGFKSSMHFYSMGIVAMNKERDTKTIKVWPYEILPGLKNELSDETVEDEKIGINYQGQDRNPDGQTWDKYKGDDFNVKIKKGAVIPAIWYGDTNRYTAPDVRRGEQVEIWRAGNSQKFFWKSIGRDDNLRRLETVTYLYNGNPENADAEQTPENCYSYTVSTHDGHITLSTSMANGEAAGFTHQFNTKDGQFTLQDEKENFWWFDSVNTIFTFKNKDGTEITLDKKKIRLLAEERVELRTQNLEIQASNVTINGDVVDWTAASSFTLNGGSTTFNCDVQFAKSVKFTQGFESTAPVKAPAFVTPANTYS